VDGKVVFGPAKKLDFDVESAALVGKGNTQGEPIDVDRAEEHMFGVGMTGLLLTYNDGNRLHSVQSTGRT
jgi:2-keto-4-pentenoate hydratase/2-oxohepta-3-ene-1,7-dioic acid hydratase in catechol pathway